MASTADITNRVEWVAGNKRCASATVTFDDSETWVTALGVIDGIHVVPTTAISPGATIAGGTVTMVNAAGGVARVTVYGA